MRTSDAPREVVVYCKKTGQITSRQGNGPDYQILNSQETHKLHVAHMYFPPAVVHDKPEEQEIQLIICTNSDLEELRRQEISIRLPKLKVKTIVKKGFWQRLRKKKNAELKIKNLASYPVRIFNIIIVPDKAEVTYLETDVGKICTRYPIVIPGNSSKKIGFKIKSTLKEWLRNDMNLCKIPVKIYANTGFDPEDPSVFVRKTRTPSRCNLWTTIIIGIVCIIALLAFLFFRQSKHDVVVYSYPYGQTVYVNGKSQGKTPVRLKLAKNEKIRIGDSTPYRVKDVLKDGYIFPSNGQENSQVEAK